MDNGKNSGPGLRVIPTAYGGILFRSRIEVRWAVFFDAVGLDWEYEKEGFQLVDRSWYLPDFWLRDLRTWYEVKGEEPTADERRKAGLLAEGSGSRVVIAFGPIPAPPNEPTGTGSAWAYFPEGGEDYGYSWCACLRCGRVGVEFEGRGDRICRHDQSDRGHDSDDEKILRALSMARNEQF